MSGYAAAMMMALLASLFFLAALFTWIATNYGLDLAFLAVAAILTVAAIAFFVVAEIARAKAQKRAEAQQARIKGYLAAKDDPIADYIPEELLAHPVSRKILSQIDENPIIASATALGVGVLLSQQLMDATD